jgi:hypothetical protein
LAVRTTTQKLRKPIDCGFITSISLTKWNRQAHQRFSIS